MRKIGSLQALDGNHNFSEADADYIGFLFHGFGADAYDLQSLSDVIKSNKKIFWIFPQGVHSVSIGPGWTGRAWWPLDLEKIQQAMARGEDRDLKNQIPANLSQLRTLVFNMVAHFNVPWSKVILGGFSQGAMLSTDISLAAPENPAALIALSGAPINYEDWKNKVSSRTDFKFFQSHGRYDDILPYRGASQLESLFHSGKMKGSLFSFEGTHEIPLEVIQKLNHFLDSL